MNEHGTQRAGTDPGAGQDLAGQDPTAQDPTGQGQDGADPTIRVLVVDDHGIFAHGVASEIGAAEAGLEVVGLAEDVDEAIARARLVRPDVILLDVHLPGGSGGGGAEVAEVLEQLTTPRGTPVRALALSVSDAEEDVLAVIRAGARGYVTKSITAPELVDAIVRVADGDAVFSPRLAGFVLDAFRGTAPPTPTELDLLSPREQEVMKMIARGYTYREAAAALFISDRTVESHVSSVLRKLQLTNRHELAKWARARRVI
jgi:DNA-binding NarL/FixJ family response regulator